MQMISTRFLSMVGTVAMLAAAPAFAQTNTQTGSTGVGGVAENPTAHETMPRSSRMAPGDRSGMDSHRSRMGHSSGSMHSRADSSADTSADRLNEQSYQAARNGQAYSGQAYNRPSSMGDPSTMGGSGGMNNSGSMNDMSGGSMTGTGNR